MHKHTNTQTHTRLLQRVRSSPSVKPLLFFVLSSSPMTVALSVLRSLAAATGLIGGRVLIKGNLIVFSLVIAPGAHEKRKAVLSWR